MSHVDHLVCKRCGTHASPAKLVNLCVCGGPFEVHYDLEPLTGWRPRERAADRPGLWRYLQVLPVDEPGEIVSLGEGATPLLALPRLAEALGIETLWMKEEGVNPTGSFKARGMAVAVTMARRLGARKLAVPSAGNAAGALAAYAARAGLEAHIFMPRDAPLANRVEVELYGAKLTLVEGLITDCGRLVAERKEREGWFDLSTLKEPYRVEGKKTMGYELFEDLGGRLPDWIFYPTGGGTGLIGMWKAFGEMERLGWIGPERPKMVSVQAAGCAPIVRAFERGDREAAPWEHAETSAAGLRVPKAVGDFWMLEVLRESGGTAVAVEEDSLLAGIGEIARQEGLFISPEGAACLPALRDLIARDVIGRSEEVVIFNTGSGLKYLDVVAPGA